jgi:histidinol-phosphate/aromatic aminotransferase/cobyric acid decarboxylase-like protein
MSTSIDFRHHGDRYVRPGDADHAVNVLAGGPPSWLRTALAEALDADAERYPDDSQAVAAVAAMHGRTTDEVVITNGAAEALWLLGPALRPRLSAILHPGFTESEAALRAHGFEVERVYRDPAAGFALDPDAIPTNAELAVVGNPGSPEGTLYTRDDILALRSLTRTLVVDEAFMSMVPAESESLAGQPHDDVIVIRSMTKLLSVPGVRVGYALAPQKLATAMRAVRPPWSANVVALAALKAAAAHPAELTELAQRANREHADLDARLQQLTGIRVWPSAADFSLIEVADGPAVVAALQARRIAVRPAGSFPGLGPNHIRLTARDPDRNAALVTALAEVLAASPS